MSKGIKLSKKHGLNPTLGICAWCGKETGEIALLGKLKGDQEAPRESILNYDPCPECLKKWKEGVAIIEVSDIPAVPNQPPIKEDVYPTGRHIVVDPSALIGDWSAGKRALMMADEFQSLFDTKQ